ncbi:MAG: Fe-S cluster assembly protein SufD [Brevundimonas sp.]|uniref:Fe-S cluster assembly protein SufD n=1 Tax=Brevundimonas sp. TaxID=1871086 RepID=UPI0025C48788|nr:Fe-S cluster assembly protein SufD [Brevundimonas sp.]MBX3476627.1 Fe-S cluster assembly protein SufD [Brevundimonas sp.]
MTLVDLRDPSSFPTRRVEAWKYTDLRRFLRETPPASAEATVAPGGPFAALGGQERAVVNGRLQGFTDIVADGDDPAPVRLRFVSTEAGAGHQPRLKIEVAAGGALTLLESHEGRAAGYVSNVALDIRVGAGARLTRVILADEADDAIALSRAEVSLGAGAVFNQTLIATGAKLQRLETHVSHPGQGAAVRMDGLYLLSGARHADLTSVVAHQGRGGVTSQLTKGVVRDTARGVFQGRIVVARGADDTDARMGHHALILSDRGEIDAKPELVIYADEVSCAHGNTVGALDESALFYMQQRGIPAEEARALLTQAFLIEVVDRIGHEGARDVARDWLEARL